MRPPLVSRLARLARRAKRDDDGAALVSVVGLIAVTAIVCIAVTSSVISATSVTTLVRAGVQSEAAAQAGIDYVLGQFAAKKYPCSYDATAQTPSFSITATYTTSTGAAISCNAAQQASSTPANASIVSTGRATLKGTASAGRDTHRMGATVSITSASTPAAALDKALFTESAFNLTNDSYIDPSSAGALDGDVYTNGALTCATQNVISGTIAARGAVTVTNLCQTKESIWSGGNVDLSNSNVKVAGDLYAVGTVVMSNAHIEGNVIANGNVTINTTSTACASGATANVCGSLYSLNGTVTMTNDAKVGGSIYARGAVNIGNNGTLVAKDVISLNGNLLLSNSATVGGNVKVYGTAGSAGNITASKTCASNFAPVCTTAALTLPLPTAANPAFNSTAVFNPATATNLGTRSATVSVTAPARQGFPKIESSATALTTYWSGWVRPAVSSDACTSANTINTLIAAQASGTKLLLIFPCKVVIDNASIQTSHDVALMSTAGFAFSNDTRVSSTDGTGHDVMFIAPADSPGVTWAAADAAFPGQLKATCSSGPGITANKLIVSNSNRILLYTPCNLSIQNAKDNPFIGQIYAGTADFPGGLRITRANIAAPGVVVPGSTSTPVATGAFTVLTRFDIG
jgi:predicted acyltransferase (DUF342 family)